MCLQKINMLNLCTQKTSTKTNQGMMTNYDHLFNQPSQSASSSASSSQPSTNNQSQQQPSYYLPNQQQQVDHQQVDHQQVDHQQVDQKQDQQQLNQQQLDHQQQDHQLEQDHQQPSSQKQITSLSKLKVQNVENALIELVELLNDEDEVIVVSALKVVYHLFHQSEHKNRAVTCVPLVKTVIDLVMRSEDGHSIIKYAAAILGELSQTRTGLRILFENGALHPIYKFMQSGIESITHYAITVLHNMLLKLYVANIAVRKTGGIYYIVKLMAKSNNTKFLAVIADCLRSLAYGSQDGKELILEYGGTHELIRIFSSNNYEKLLWIIARCIKVLDFD